MTLGERTDEINDLPTDERRDAIFRLVTALAGVQGCAAGMILENQTANDAMMQAAGFADHALTFRPSA